MSHVTRLSVVIAGVALLGGSAWAIKDPETGIVFPDSTRCDGAAARAAGVGVREATMGIDVYGVVVYVGGDAAGKSLRGSGGCVKILAKFVRSVGADKIRGAWIKGAGRYGVSSGDATLQKFLSVVSGEMKKGGYMVIETHNDKVFHRYMSRDVTVTGAKKLARALKSIYVGPGSPTPALVKDLRKRGVAHP